MRSPDFRALVLASLMVLAAASVANAASLTLAWDAPTDELTTGYVVVYGTASGVYTSRVDVGFVTLRKVDGLLNSTRYYFRVQAYDENGVLSDYSAEVSGTTAAASGGGGSTGGGGSAGGGSSSGGTSASSGATGTPGGTSAVAVMRDGRFIDISWLPVPGVNEYRVEVGGGRGHTAFSAYTPNVAMSFDTMDMPSIEYYVRVRNIVGGLPGPTSNEEIVLASAFPRLDVSTDVAGAACGGAPGAPRQFAARADGTAVQLGWNPGGGSPAAAYVLQVGSAPGLQNLMLMSFPGGQHGLGASAAFGSYALRLYATNDCGQSVWGAENILNVGGASAAGSANVAAAGAPGNFTESVSGTLVTLSWTAPAGGAAATRYLIEATIADGTVVASLDTGNPSTTFSHPNTPAGQYFVTVRAGNAAGFGPPTPVVTVVVP